MQEADRKDKKKKDREINLVSFVISSYLYFSGNNNLGELLPIYLLHFM
jgi:hypothetical protein